jgi:allophanate hydrolase
MYEIAGKPPLPGVVRVAAGEGVAIEAELWSLSPAALGEMLAGTAPPLSIGTVALADGRQVKGFLCEAAAVGAARDITEFGGWRRFLAART